MRFFVGMNPKKQNDYKDCLNFHGNPPRHRFVVICDTAIPDSPVLGRLPELFDMITSRRSDWRWFVQTSLAGQNATQCLIDLLGTAICKLPPLPRPFLAYVSNSPITTRSLPEFHKRKQYKNYNPFFKEYSALWKKDI